MSIGKSVRLFLCSYVRACRPRGEYLRKKRKEGIERREKDERREERRGKKEEGKLLAKVWMLGRYGKLEIQWGLGRSRKSTSSGVPT